VVPFVTETFWQNLKAPGDPESVHLASFPEYDPSMRSEELEFRMDTVRKAVSMGRSLRYQYNLKIRQPLKSVEFVTRNPEEKKVLLEMEESIREELNVKKAVFHEREDELVEYAAKPAFRVLGKELGPRMKDAAGVIESLDAESIQSILDGAVLSIDVKGTPVELTAEKIVVERRQKEHLRVVNEDTLTVALDSEITADLQKEGWVRDLIRGLQNLRKSSGLDVTDRIALRVSGSPALKAAFDAFSEFIAAETLASTIEWAASLPGSVQIEAGDETWSCVIRPGTR
ncbi:MAG: DUF5915 domain-containing protein, partial [Spirochaetaceae bacterium]|jgi:isoleucyl-tRNA synthetase|nr:DUF5915 domain-containing protein [Spirochaetaceae bacterium]